MPDDRRLKSFLVNGPNDIREYNPMENLNVSPLTTGDTIKRFFASLGSEDIGLSPDPMQFGGMVINDRNAKMLQNTLKYLFRNEESPSVQRLAAAYTRLKYPGITRNISIEEKPPVFAGFLKTLLGSYDQDTKKVVQYLNEGRNLENEVNTLGHEFTHAIQAKKDPIGLKTAYIPSSGDYDKYYNQFWEVDARRGGETAEKTFKKFINTISDAPKFDAQTPITKDDVNNYLMPLIAERLKEARKFVDKYPTYDSHYPTVVSNIQHELKQVVDTLKGDTPFDYTWENIGSGYYNTPSYTDLINKKLKETKTMGFKNVRFMKSTMPEDVRTPVQILLGR